MKYNIKIKIKKLQEKNLIAGRLKHSYTMGNNSKTTKPINMH